VKTERALVRIPPRYPRILPIRRGGDSNPRYPLEAQLLSREPDSAALAPLQMINHRRGAGGIRTLGTFRHSGFQDRLLKPLGHRSSNCGTKTYGKRKTLSIRLFYQITSYLAQLADLVVYRRFLTCSLLVDRCNPDVELVDLVRQDLEIGRKIVHGQVPKNPVRG
jgi:hypothetical protein